jgi:hypothetical protein
MSKRKSPLDEAAYSNKDDPPLKLRRRLNVQNFVLVWLDTKRNEEHLSINQFRQSIDMINTFMDTDQCVDFLTDIEDLKIFLIISDVLGQQFITLIHEIPQIYSIYIFYEDKSKDKIWINDWAKVQGGFINTEDICSKLEQDITLHSSSVNAPLFSVLTTIIYAQGYRCIFFVFFFFPFISFLSPNINKKRKIFCIIYFFYGSFSSNHPKATRAINKNESFWHDRCCCSTSRTWLYNSK